MVSSFPVRDCANGCSQSVHAAKFYTPQNLEIMEKLGEGTFAEVFMARVKKSREMLVVKVFKAEVSDGTDGSC